MGNCFIYVAVFMIISILFAVALPLLAFLIVVYGALMLASLIV